MSYHYELTTDKERERMDRYECAWCGTSMDELSVVEAGRLTCGPRCRQARYRARRKAGLPT